MDRHSWHRGQVTHTWGEAAYPTQNEYDSHGRRTKLHTYRGGSGWDGTTWPTGSAGTADTTTWAYDAATGLLNSKTDAASRTVSYTYTAAGQLDVRTWARGVTTDYNYDVNTGELTSANYSDTTPDITNVYNRRGLLDSVTDFAGVRLFDYCDCGKVTKEHLGTFHDSRHLSYQLDTTTTGAKGRTTGYTLKDSTETTTLHQLSYDFDASGRLDEIVTAGAMGAYTFDYGYEPSSNLVKTLDIRNGTTGDPFNYTRTWASNRNVVTQAKTSWNTTAIAQYDYTYDAMHRRESAVQSGTAFADYLITTHRRYGYNARSELTSDIAYSGSDVVSAPYGDLSGRRFEFTYDNLGNRLTSNRTGVAALADQYTTNNLNQYTARENNTLAVAGTVANSTINVVATPASGTPQGAGRAGGYWGAEVVPGNATGPVQQTVNVVAAEPGSGATSLVSTDSVSAPVAPASQAYTYDNDGNPLSDDLWSYTWDAENRLIAMETSTGAVTGGVTKEKLEFAYDYLHRRVEKKVYSWTGSAWSLAKHYKFVYEGWNVIREDEVVGSKAKTLAWGLDIMGSLSGSAGVQGLIAMRDTATSTTYLPGYDAGGNVAVLLDAADGSIEATYEYSPFGQFLRKEGAYAKANPVRFSTKYTDEETDLVYYGRRYYDPKDGRFVGRDPIEEQGGINLYAFVMNSPLNRWDYLGMGWLSRLLIYADKIFSGDRDEADIAPGVVDIDPFPVEVFGTGEDEGPSRPAEPDVEIPTDPNFGMPSDLGFSGDGGGGSDPNQIIESELEKLRRDCEERARLAAEGEEAVHWNGSIEYEFVALVGSYGSFQGTVISNEIVPRVATVSGQLYGVGIQAGYFSGLINNVSWIGNDPSDISGANGAFFNWGAGIGAGPLDIFGFGGEIPFFRGDDGTADVSDWGDWGPSYPDVATSTDPFDPGSYFQNPRLGPGAGAGVNGFNVTNFEITSDPCDGLD